MLNYVLRRSLLFENHSGQSTFSLAGKRLASLDSRNLFGEFFRILCKVRPKWAIVENVPGLLTAESGQFLRTVLWQFASSGFDVEWGALSASQVGAIHKRERVWIIATNSQSSRRDTSWYQRIQERTNLASVGGGDAGNSQKHRLTNSVEYGAFSQPTSSRGDARRTVPQGWTDVSLPTPDLIIGSPLPQSPALIGLLVLKLQRLRQKTRQNIANSMRNTKALEDNTNKS